ncbi:DUF1273 domain-containing protein [Streptococcus sp. S784/96/1]|uniref:DUF1273 domain-containing protein n=1 Tax=Streptococcus sp. S784/96/1 TaxID=2653499 RepID=UPI001386D059|nr:DUF1273 domain-containing protein [Streptococcus sp. S784/96/1]
MTAFLITGYKNTELGIFQDKDERVEVIKKIIRRDLIRLAENGVDWLIFTGNLGFEYWVLEVANELKHDYGFSLATIFTFENHGENWNENNQEKLALFKAVDYVKYAFVRYDNPGQFRQYNQFLLDNTQGAYLFYDSEHETSLKYLYHLMTEKEQYELKRLTIEELNDFATDLCD